MRLDIVELLTAKDDKKACELAFRIIKESNDSDKWYEYFDEIASLLHHPKSLVRNRALTILAANAKWDDKNKFDDILNEYLSHITDEKPITARQCIKALLQIAQAKQNYTKQIKTALQNVDLSKYKDSMKPLIEKDIYEVLTALN